MNDFDKLSYSEINREKRVVIGLSGGVDSAVSAYLLKQAGYEVSSVYLMCWKEPGCRALDDRKDALQTALELGISFEVLDFRKEYKERVMDYFYNEYKEGRTPNPDILCNSVIKFGIFYEWAMKKGFDYIATGHYSRICGEKLCTAKDLKKDQSYFLYKLKEEQLRNILFPVGGLLKKEVRKIATEEGLSVAKKKDSMGICFVGDVNVKALLEKKFGKKKGDVVLSDGTVVGEHDGYWFFNVGYRGGWKRKSKIPNLKFKNDELPILYVLEIRKDKNEVLVGEREELMRDEFVMGDINWIDEEILTELKVFAKIRNTGEFLKARLEKIGEGKLRVRLNEKVFGVSKGQSCVIYKEVSQKFGSLFKADMVNQEKEEGKIYELVGGGIIFN